MDPKRSHSKPKADSSSSGGSEDGSPASTSTANAFANDGSFMEMFKKKMEEEMKKKSEDASGSELGQTHQDRRTTPAVTSFVGKRRGGVFLKTGMVAKKQKPDTEMVPGKSDAWSKYMAEVKKYKAHQCSDDDKTRPLVK